MSGPSRPPSRPGRPYRDEPTALSQAASFSRVPGQGQTRGSTDVVHQRKIPSRREAPVNASEPRHSRQWPRTSTSSKALVSSHVEYDGWVSDGSPGLSDCIPSSTSASIHDHSLSSAKNSNVKSSNGSTNGVTKDSRYLREMDRRDILHRIKQGEKQSALAKEYNISRSAVCNLNKKRVAVLARKCDNPLAKHPKLNRRAAASKATAVLRDNTASQDQVAASAISSSTGDGVILDRFDSQALTHEPPCGGLYLLKSSHRVVALLLSRVQDRATSESDFRRCADRAMRLVLEEAMALVQLRVVEIKSTVSSSKSSNTSRASLLPLHSTCALSLEQDGCPMLDLINLLEPELSTGYVRISSRSSVPQNGYPRLPAPASKAANQDDSLNAQPESPRFSVHILQAHVPRDLSQYNVLLLDTVVHSGEAVCCTIEQVIAQLGGVEKRISLVALFISSDAVEKVKQRYPHVRIVAADGESSQSQDVELAAKLQQRLTNLM
ncbi:hypothetical protein Gpo141_00013192 [Globisporangium polare]